MIPDGIPGWDRLRHGGLLLDPQRLSEVALHNPEPLPTFYERDLRKKIGNLLNDPGSSSADISSFVGFVLRSVCGFDEVMGSWQKGPQVNPDWGRSAISGETVKPRHIWTSKNGGVLPVFIDREKRVGVGRGRRIASQVLGWLRDGQEQLALITNGYQWRLVFAGLDFDAWCEWDINLWLEEGELSPQVAALRGLMQPALWVPPSEGENPPLLQAIRDSRKGQAELSQVLGERVREAVEILVQSHGEVLREHCADVEPAQVYRAAVRVVMRMVVVLFAESRELLPRDNALYHGSYGIGGLLEELEKVAARGGNRLARAHGAWPRILALFQLIREGSHHPSLPVPEYGGDLFAPGEADGKNGLNRALAVFENACFDRELLSDHEVHQILEQITRTRVKLRQGRSATWVAAPIDFSDLSSEYIGILYEGLLDFELKTAPAGDPVIFLAVGDQPALPLSRLEEMSDKALQDLFEALKDKSKKEDAQPEGESEQTEEDDPSDESAEADYDHQSEEQGDDQELDDGGDERHSTRTRAESWASRAVEVAKLVKKPRGKLTPEKKLLHERAVSLKARQLVSRVILPNEWYLVRWGGTRKGSGTFYTRPGLAVPTVQRTLRPLCFDDSGVKKPEEILALQVIDPACGSGTFPVAALRYLTDALYSSLYHHGRIHEQADRALISLLEGPGDGVEESSCLCSELLPCSPEDPNFEPRLKAVLRRHVVERCIYGVDLDPLAVELCRLALWIETMDRNLPFSFLDHKVKCGNGLVGAWFDQFRHYPVMAFKNREGGDKNHSKGVHFPKDARGKAIKAFVKTIKPLLADTIRGQVRIGQKGQVDPSAVHDETLEVFEKLHALPVHDTAERSRLYREELLGSGPWQSLKVAMDCWCACWFWPPERLDCAPLPNKFADPQGETQSLITELAAKHRFFHWELEFPDVFREEGAGFDAVMGNPPWEIAKPNSKEFFSNIDPLYRSYGKQEALGKQREYFEDQNIEQRWIDYNADLRAQSNLFKYVARPFGDPDKVEDSKDRFSLIGGKKNAELHQIWKNQRVRERGYADSSHPFSHQGSADINLYKLFLEQAHALLRQGGRMGFIVPSGLYSDYGTGGLRELFLEHCSWEWIFGFENRDKIFDIHRSFKFNPVIIEKGGKTRAINTAFMRRSLDDWERAEEFVTEYTAERVEQFSPHSKAILEIQSVRDLEILEKIYSNSVLLGDEGPDGWGIKYATEFHMTNDSKLFPPRPKWEDKGYRPDEYSRWLLGDWRPIEELWSELGTQALPEGKTRCAQPPYDRLPIPRADIPEGIVLSREADAFIREGAVKDTALPLYEGRMIGHFDNSEKGWISGKGRKAVWEPIAMEVNGLLPQYLMSKENLLVNGKELEDSYLAFIKVTSSTNRRTAFSAAIGQDPCGESVHLIIPNPCTVPTVLAASALFNSFVFDYQIRMRLSGLNMSNAVLEECVFAKRWSTGIGRIATISAGLTFVNVRCSTQVLRVFDTSVSVSSQLSITESSRIRSRCIADAVGSSLLGLDYESFCWMLREVDVEREQFANRVFDSKGFWRVDKDRDPELRQTVLTLVAFRDLQQQIEVTGGDRDAGIEAFLSQNDGQGWLLPETLCLADYGLGHDDRAKEHQPVAGRLGPRFYDWQLAQSADESWRECRLHARNLLGEEGYQHLLCEIEAEKNGEIVSQVAESDPVGYGQVDQQRGLFD